MAVVFIKIGQEVHITGGSLEDAINQGVREGYTEGYLRKSVVKDPLIREKNTKDNTPAIIQYEIIPGDKVEITVAPKSDLKRKYEQGMYVKASRWHRGG